MAAVDGGDGGDDFDADGQALSYTCFYDTIVDVTVTNTSTCTSLGASFNSTTGALTWSPNYTHAGVYQVKITATDGTYFGDAFFTVTVTNVNQIPTLTSTSIAAVTLTPSTALLIYSDADSDPASSCSVFTPPANGSTGSCTVTGSQISVTYTSNSAYTGADSFQVKVFDGTSWSLASTVSVTVRASNSPPIWSTGTLANERVAQGMSLSTLSQNFTATDADGDTLTYYIVAGGTTCNASLNWTTAISQNSSNSAFAGTPSTAVVGPCTIEYGVTDGAASISRSFSVYVVPYSPGLISLRLWLSGDSLTGNTNGAALASWPNWGGVTGSAGQATASQKPTYQAAVLNGRSVVRFDGSDDFMDLISTSVVNVLNSSSKTFFLVAKTSSTGSGNRWVFSLQEASANGTAGQLFGFGVDYSTNKYQSTYWSSTSNTGWLNPTPYTNTATFHLITMVVASSGIVTLRIDGVQHVRATNSSTPANAGAHLILGSAYSGGVSEPMASDIAELLIYETSLTGSEVAQVEGQLAERYGLTLNRGLFITATGQTANFGGLAGADSFCQSKANAALNSGVWKAVLSTSTVNAIDHVGGNATAPIRSSKGESLATSLSDMFNGVAWVPKTETGAAAATAYAWTNTTATGTAYSTVNTCADFSSTTGTIATAAQTSATATSWLYTTTTTACSTTGYRLYCLSE
jgi:hypothetical protein